MIDPVLFGKAVIYSSLLILLSLGLTLTYLTTKVPNFSHATFAAIGAFVILTLTSEQFLGGNVYNYLIIASIVSGIVSLAQYILVLRPLIKRRASIISLMITTLAIDFILVSLLNIYADYLLQTFHITNARYFILTKNDVVIAGQNGVLIVAPILAIMIVSLLYLALTRTRFGISMRAAIEDSSLASVVGVNVNFVYSVSWFTAGALAGLAGGLIPLYIPGNPTLGNTLIVPTFAGSTVGGLFNIYGAVLGGLLIGFAESLGTRFLSSLLGSWVLPYKPLIPLIAISITLLLSPRGIMGTNWKRVIARVQESVFKKTEKET